MSEVTRIKINFTSGEVEIQGSEEFVERQLENLDSVLESASLLSSNSDNTNGLTEDEQTELEIQEETAIAGAISNILMSPPDNFGEWLHRFSNKVSDTEQALIAGYYVQCHSETNDFKTSEVNRHLREHGIKLSNPSSAIQRLTKGKLAFKSRKVGKLSYFRISGSVP